MKYFTSKFETKFNTSPFSLIKLEDYKPAFIANIASAKAEIDAIINNTNDPTFENTIEALCFSGESLDRLSSIFFNVNDAETCDEMQKIAQEVSPMLTTFNNDITLNEKLFKRVKSIYDNKDLLNISPEKSTLLSRTFKAFSRNGALLTEENKVILRSIDAQLAKLSLIYSENVLAETNNYYLHITNEDDLCVNSKGFKVINHVKLIQGDGINPISIKEIINAVIKAGFSMSNVAFGMGGASLQGTPQNGVNRDTQKFAFKASYAEFNHIGRDVYKDPITDHGKRSKRGKLDLVKINGEYTTININDSLCNYPSELETVFLNGDVLCNDSFASIKNRVISIKR